MTLSILGPGPVDNELKSRPGGADSIMRLRSGPVKLRAPGEPVPDHDRLISHDCCREPAASSSIAATRRMARDGDDCCDLGRPSGVPCFLPASSQARSTPAGGIMMPLITVNRHGILSFHTGNKPQSWGFKLCGISSWGWSNACT
jgi:hypothetical protein